jgi:hypothetical protein
MEQLMTGDCPRRINVGVYLLDGLEATKAASFTRHLSRCPRCRAEIDTPAPVVQLLSSFRTAMRRQIGCSGDNGRGDGPERLAVVRFAYRAGSAPSSA